MMQSLPSSEAVQQIAETVDEVLENLVLRNADTAFISELRLREEIAAGLSRAWEEHRGFIIQRIA
jgi:prophage DNA circulation protein